MRFLNSSSAIALALATSPTFSRGVYAQAPSSATIFETVDDNSVDLRSRAFVVSSEDLRIGSGSFPQSLYINRESVGYSGNFGYTIGSNLDIFIGTAGNGASYPLLRSTSTQSVVSLTIGRSLRTFSAGVQTSTGITWQPQDKQGGYLNKSIEGSTTVYTYVTRQGDELRFLVNESTACGRSSRTTGNNDIYCTRVSTWKSANGVTANFAYNSRGGRDVGFYSETDLASVTNSIGYSLTLGYTRFKDSGRNTDPVYAVTSASARSTTQGSCSGQPSCQRTVGYQYITAPPESSSVLAFTRVFLSSFTNATGATTQYVYSKSNNPNYLNLQAIRRPEFPNTDALSIVFGGDYYGIRRGDSLWKYIKSSTTWGFTTTRVDPLGNSRVYAFSADGYLSTITDEEGNVYSYSSNAAGRPTQIKTPRGLWTNYLYDQRGNLVSVTKASATNIYDVLPVYSATYEPDTCTNPKVCNQPITTTDSGGATTDYLYDGSHGGVVSITQPAPAKDKPRPQKRFSYGLAMGAVVLTQTSQCQTLDSCNDSKDETRTTIGYGTDGVLPTSITTQAGDGSSSASSRVSYDALGNAIRVEGPAGPKDTTYRKYDAMGRVVGVIYPDPDGSGPRKSLAQRSTYNGSGNRILVENGYTDSQSDTALQSMVSVQTLESKFDINSLKTRDLVSSGGVIQNVNDYSYDSMGRLVCSTVRMDRSQFSSEAPACTAQTQGEDGDRITRTIYNKVGQIKTISRGEPTVLVNETSDFTADGLLEKVTDANGNITSYDYDGFDRLQTITFPGGSYEQFSYSAGHVASHRLRDGQTINYTYDSLGQRIKDDNPNTNVAEVDAFYDYDNLGRLIKASDQNGWYSAWDYDALGRVTRQYSNVSSNTFEYDTAGRLVKQKWSDPFFVTYDYDNTGEMTVIRENGVMPLATFDYDNLRRRVSVVRGNGTVTNYHYGDNLGVDQISHDLADTTNDLSISLTYNSAGQLSTRTTSNGKYDYVGNYNVVREYSVNSLNQYTKSGSIIPNYDSRGNLVSSADQSYTFNTRNELFQSNTSGSLFYRNPVGLLNQIVTSSGTTNLDYVGGRLVAEFNGTTGSLLRRYVFGPGIDEPLVWYEGSGLSDRRYLHTDERGSVIALSDNSGNLLRINTYDEHGIPGPNNLGRFQYTGQQWISELGMYDYKARIYSPTLGRFLQPDPTGYADGLNWYNYVGNDPINSSDPSGMESCPEPSGPASLYFCTFLPGGKDENGNSNEPRSYPAQGYGHLFDFGGYGALKAIYANALKRLGWSTGTLPTQYNTCLSSAGSKGATVVDRVGDAHGAIFGAGALMAKRGGDAAAAATIGRAALPGAYLLSGVSAGVEIANDRAAGMSTQRATIIHGVGFVGGLLGGFVAGTAAGALFPFGGEIAGGIYGGAKGGDIGKDAGAVLATALGYCR